MVDTSSNYKSSRVYKGGNQAPFKGGSSEYPTYISLIFMLNFPYLLIPISKMSNLPCDTNNSSICRECMHGYLSTDLI